MFVCSLFDPNKLPTIVPVNFASIALFIKLISIASKLFLNAVESIRQVDAVKWIGS